MTSEQLLNLKLDGNTTLYDLLSLAAMEGQITVPELGDDSSFIGIAEKIINSIK